jgi:hypothetical protein
MITNKMAGKTHMMDPPREVYFLDKYTIKYIK